MSTFLSKISLSGIQKLPFLEQILWFIGLSLAGWLLTLLVMLIWERLILPIASKTNSSLDDHLAKNIHKPLIRLMVLGSIFLAGKITIAGAKEIKTLIGIIENVLYLILIIFIASLIDAILKSFIDWYLQDIASKTDSSLDDTLFPIFRKAGAVVIYFIAATVILGQFKVNLTGFLATAGVASLAIAFAAQESLSNVISGVSILMDRSFHIGERIELKDGLIGDVVEIGLRSTKILSLDRRLIIVPNKEIGGARLVNWSQPDISTNIKLKLAFSLDEDIERVKQIILSVCSQEKLLSKKQAPAVMATGFGPYFIELLVVAVVKDCRESGLATDSLVVKLQQAFIKEGVKLPLPQQIVQVSQD